MTEDTPHRVAERSAGGSLRPVLRLALVAILAVLSALPIALPAAAQISPGKLSAPHAALDSSASCLDCHSSKRGVDPVRCLSCHGALAERIERGEGLHARDGHASCERCHIEHQGREFELIYWGDGGARSFDHALAGWPLAGAHARAGCRDCHRPDRLGSPERLAAGGADPARTFLGLDTACASCHRDPHEGQFGAAGCASCHSPAAWRPAPRFDHSETAFPLSGRHEPLACEECHRTPRSPAEGTAVRFRGLPTACASCHADPHAGRLGTSCESCHDTRDWRRIDRAGFDHDRTAYPLRGRHAAVACASCHRPGRPLRVAGFDRCATCHADAHAGQLTVAAAAAAAAAGSAGAAAAAPDCARCHTVQGFRPARFTVAEHESTAYPLEGAHRTVACAECHADVRPEEIEREGVRLTFAGRRPARLVRLRFGDTSCQACHGDPHEGQVDAFLGAAGCVSCHGVAGWSEISFDHGRTRFELAGAHAAVGCRSCHEPARAAAGGGRSGGAGGAGRAGGRTGAVPVAAREPPGALRLGGVPADCAGCHADPHLGQFVAGPPVRGCEACHAERDWSPARFDHRRDTAFALEGAHRAVACVSCHPRALPERAGAMRFRGVSRACVSCHASANPAG